MSGVDNEHIDPGFHKGSSPLLKVPRGPDGRTDPQPTE
jgi:hypothetical protein